MVWASQKCKVCYGRGMVIKIKTLDAEKIARIGQSDPKALQTIQITNREKGTGIMRSQAPCVCTQPRYNRAKLIAQKVLDEKKQHQEEKIDEPKSLIPSE